MKILFSARPAFGHVYPMMPLALAARDTGHDVRFATTGTFLASLEALGFPTHDVGITFDEAIGELMATLADGGTSLDGDGVRKGDDGRPDMAMGARLFLEFLAPRTADDVGALLERLDVDVVVYEQSDIGAAVAANAAGVPAVSHAISPKTSTEAFRPYAEELLAQLWAAHGVTSPGFDAFDGESMIDIFPDAMQPPSVRSHPARLRLRPMPYSPPGAVAPAWLGTTSRPLVYLTLGTVVATDEVLRPAIDGLASLDVDVLVALGSAAGASLGALPGNVRVEPFVDQPAVLRHAALVVHHAGSGTILGALDAGVPQLLLPKGADQFVNADAMAAAGIAHVLAPAAATADAIAEAARATMGRLTPPARAARAELASMPSPRAVAAQLEDRFGRGQASTAA